MLTKSIRYLKGVGPKWAVGLARLGIHTVEDLLFYAPRRYEDWRTPLPIATLFQKNTNGDEILIEGTIQKTGLRELRRGWKIFWARIQDPSGETKAIWFNQPFLQKLLTPGKVVRLRGKPENSPYEKESTLQVRDFILVSPDEKPGLLPHYPLTEGISQKWFRKWMLAAVQAHRDQIIEFLPLPHLDRRQLPERRTALNLLHFPAQAEEGERARRRFVFEELLLFQLALLVRRIIFRQRVRGIPFTISETRRDEFISRLPFQPTAGQITAMREIEADMARPTPMSRLLQGDVGSGKTMVAAYGAFISIRNGYQCAVMAPTEVLVDQHLQSLGRFLEPHGIQIRKMTRAVKGKQRILSEIEEGRAPLIVGTHALITQSVHFHNLGLVIIDEQHRFGVMERAKLEQKGVNPDLLMMTATPIPRSLALSAYGDLDRSIIRELPPGRPVIHTYYVPKKKRSGMVEFLRRAMAKSEQVFVVCPLVAESETLDLKAAIAEAENLREVFPEFQVGLLHGRMKSTEKEKIMHDFREKRLHLLVSTTVIEVGVDVPNATIMVIEQCERFGLAQLHQLRGRIGRGEKEAFCFLLGNPVTSFARARVRAMTRYRDGFRLAELDLRLRGPGELTGLSQSGLPPFRFADIIRDEKVMWSARVAAKEILEQDPPLQKVEHHALKQEVILRFGRSLRLGRLQ